MDLLNSKPPSRGHSHSKSSACLTDTKNGNIPKCKPLIRLQSAQSSNLQKANDVYQALQDLKVEL